MALVTINNYAFDPASDKLGEGQYGQVYRAKDLKRGGRPCVLKILHRSADPNQEPFIRAHFQKEVDLLQKMHWEREHGLQYIIQL